MSLSKYEHLEEVRIEGLGAPPSEAVSLTRRRSDGKVFLATGVEDGIGLLDRVGEQLKRLLSHPNLVCLIDIVRDSEALGGCKDSLVWDRCDTNLGKVLSQVQTSGEEELAVPESLCWHVLSGINQALQYLHTGQKRAYLWGQQMVVDDDWQGVLCASISPTTIYFTSPKGRDTYGTVKLGCFKDAVVTSGASMQVRHPPLGHGGEYKAPVAVSPLMQERIIVNKPQEIRKRTHDWSPAAEVWSLGAVVYHMMVGHPPLERDMTSIIPCDNKSLHYYIDAIPNRYSNELRTLVYEMLHISRKRRPTAQELTTRIGAGLSFWRDKTDEEYIVEE
ncbi:MAG: hypothetical protein M1840_004503 [Geoglossum simile]|nr:MAG: hypothetical protein M1840_004503 [Geoglossum simile]